VPRLGRFLQRHPDFDVRVSPTEHLVDFRIEPVDVGIRYGKGSYPGLLVDKLAGDALVVVCAPALCAGRRSAASDLLARHVLLHDDAPDAWAEWLTAQGIAPARAPRHTELTDSSMVVEAAVRGQGIALARWSLAMDDLLAGRLVLPFPRARPLSTALAYYMACPQSHIARPEVAAFRAWIRREARALARQLPGVAQGVAQREPRG
jgi:LysR family glycine cleavage system transcriptional activator